MGQGLTFRRADDSIVGIRDYHVTMCFTSSMTVTLTSKRRTVKYSNDADKYGLIERRISGLHNTRLTNDFNCFESCWHKIGPTTLFITVDVSNT